MTVFFNGKITLDFRKAARPWVSNYVHYFLWDVITHADPKFNGSLANPCQEKRSRATTSGGAEMNRVVVDNLSVCKLLNDKSIDTERSCMASENQFHIDTCFFSTSFWVRYGLQIAPGFVNHKDLYCNHSFSTLGLPHSCVTYGGRG